MSLTAAKVRRAAQRELDRRAKAGTLQPPTVNIRACCHPKQATLVESIVLGKIRNVAAKAGRQSGKSHGGAALAPMLVVRAFAGVNAIVVTATDASCEKMAFKPAVALNREHGLGGTPHYSKGDLSIAFPNGSTVYYLGAKNQATIDRLRGTPNLVLCVIDEAGIYESATLKEMIDAVRPGLRPRRGKLVVMGTPSKQGKQGTWFDITENPEYEQHSFDYRDNDRVPDFATVEQTVDEDLRAQFKEIGLGAMTIAQARETAWFKREYYALFEVDLAEQVYQLTDANLVDDIPENHEVYATGGDIGVSANDALVSAGWSGDARAVYIVDQEEESGQDSTACADMVNEHNTKRHPLFIALDAGGLGSKTIRTVQALYPEVPAVEAEKPAIGVQVRAFNSLAAGGRLKVKRGSKLALELVGPTWVDGIVGGKIDEHGRHSDLVPSVRYLAVKLVAILPGLADAPPPPDERARRVGAALRKARKPTFDDERPVRDELGQEMEPGSPWG